MAISRTAARRARYKLLVSILTTHGYAILGFAVIQPLLTGHMTFTAVQIVAMVIGLAAQAYAIYIAPYGEPS